MQAQKHRRIRGALFLLTVSLALSGCTFSLDWFRYYRAQGAIERLDYVSGLEALEKIVQNNPDSPRALEAARLGARIAQLNTKNFYLAVEFYKVIVLRSQDIEERKSAQRSIAMIYFENLQDFNQALVEFEKLLKLGLRPEEVFRYRLDIAKSHLRMNNIDQALNELDILLSQNQPPDAVFETKVLKANTLVAAKRMPEAVTAWQEILKEFPEKSAKENVALNLVVCYEEQKDFGKAIEVLEGMSKGYSHPEFLELRIQRLKERMGNQPGAQGLKR